MTASADGMRRHAHAVLPMARRGLPFLAPAFLDESMDDAGFTIAAAQAAEYMHKPYLVARVLCLRCEFTPGFLASGRPISILL